MPDLAGRNQFAVKAINENASLGEYKRPERPVIERLARSPELANRIRTAAQKRLNSIIKRQAAKARAA